MRLIDADVLLENYDLKDAVKYGNKDREQQYKSYGTLMMYEIADMIHDAPTIDPPGWIPCGERLPDFSDVPVMCSGDSSKPCIITAFVKRWGQRALFPARRVRRVYADGRQREFWTGASGTEIKPDSGFDVLAWQPLPDPFQGEA